MGPNLAQTLIEFEPLGDRIVVLPDSTPDEILTQSGLVLMTEQKEATTGRIVAFGPQVSGFQLNQRVVFSPWTGFHMVVQKTGYKIVTEGEILGTIPESGEVRVE